MMSSTSLKKRSHSKLIHEDVPRWNTAGEITRAPVVLVAFWRSVNAMIWITRGDLPGAVVPLILALLLGSGIYFCTTPGKG